MVVFVETEVSGETLSHVGAHSKKKFQYDVKPSDSVDSVKERVCREIGVAPNQHRLILDVPLDDRPTLADCGVKHESVLQLAVIVAVGHQRLTPRGKHANLTVKARTLCEVSTVTQALKKKLAEI
jgi:hypothetical protein